MLNRISKPAHASNRRELIYLGWQGNDNFGDELLWDAWKVALGRDLGTTAPLTLGRYLVKNVVRFLGQRLRLIGSERVVLLGGGTTIGFGTWARHTSLAARMYGRVGVVIPGAGAASHNDAFSLAKQPADWPAWGALSNVALFGVRGPMTADECGRGWRPTDIIGDPALLYPLHADLNLPSGRSNVIGLCLGSDKSTRFDIDTVVEAVCRAASITDAEVVIFQVADTDAEIAELTAARIGSGTRVVRFTGDVAAMMEEIARCSVFISERLHGAVAAVSLGVPTVPLSYASKCDDFWMSVTGERSPITVGHSADDLFNAIERSRDEQFLASISAAVRELQARLGIAAGLLRDWLAARISTEELMRVDARRILAEAARFEAGA